MRCVYKRRRCCNDQVDLRYARMQIVHKPTTTKDEGCRVDTKDIQFQDGILGNSWWYWFK
jgi:hypothetical protein